jgi:hypothetical protein
VSLSWKICFSRDSYKDPIEDITPGFRRWLKIAANIAYSGLMTTEARRKLAPFMDTESQISQQDMFVQPFDSWPFLIIMDAICSPHNDFIRILSKHTPLRTNEVSDFCAPDCFDDLLRLDMTDYGRRFLCVYRGNFDENGMISFSEEKEALFCKTFEKSQYYYVVLSSINGGVEVISSAPCEDLVTRFEQSFPVKDLSRRQRVHLWHVLKESEKAGLIMFIEKVMWYILSQTKYTIDKRLKPGESVSNFIVDNDVAIERTLNSNEKEGKVTLSSLDEEFSISQLSRLYSFLQEPGGDVVDDVIIDQFLSFAKIERKEIVPHSFGFEGTAIRRGLVNVIPKCLCALNDKWNDLTEKVEKVLEEGLLDNDVLSVEEIQALSELRKLFLDNNNKGKTTKDLLAVYTAAKANL